MVKTLFHRYFRSVSLALQLTSAVLFVTLVSFLSSVFISTLSVKTSFEQELYLKNLDNANGLAMLLSQMDKDPVELELLISATFDTGHYLLIELKNPEGDSMVKREYNGEEAASSPAWFNRLIQFDIAPGVAQISDGWQQYGTLYVKSQVDFTKEALWQSTLRLTLAFLVLGCVAGIATLWAMARILNPLKDVILQARAFGEKRFIQIREPATKEFAAVVRSMNTLAERFSQMMDEANRRLEKIKYQAEHDDETLLARRDYFLDSLKQSLGSGMEVKNAALVMFRLENLDELIHRFGRASCIKQLREFSEQLLAFFEALENQDVTSEVGRLNHTDFAIYLDDTATIDQLQNHIAQLMLENIRRYPQSYFEIRHAAVYVEPGDTHSTLLARADHALTQGLTEQVAATKEHDWKAAIEEALAKREMEFSWQPVSGFAGEVLHHQLGVQLRLEGEWRSFGFYAPLLLNTGLFCQFDWSVVRRVSALLEQDTGKGEIAIELSAQTLADEITLASIFTYLSTLRSVTSFVCFEVNESVAVELPREWNEVCRQAKLLGIKLGLRRAGNQLTQLAKLQEQGLDYIKIDGSLVHNLAGSPEKQAYLREICQFTRTLGIKVLSHSGASPQELELLEQLGFAGKVDSSQDEAGH